LSTKNVDKCDTPGIIECCNYRLSITVKGKRVNEIKKAAVLGANGNMGSLSGGIFAQAGIPCVYFARNVEKAQKGIENAVKQARSDVLREYIVPKSYEDLEKELPGCDWVLEAVAEEISLKREFFRTVDRLRKKGSVVSTISSSLSIASMAEEASKDFKAHFCGVHFFNPPGKLLANEIIYHPMNSEAFKTFIYGFCEKSLRRMNIVTRDTPGFAGNRVGFQFLNEAAIQAEAHGVETIDYLLGPHTGRILPPLATIDLVGLDVHREVVNNIYSNVRDEMHDSFKLPAYARTMVEKGMLGCKSSSSGGFYRFAEKKEKLVLAPGTIEYLKTANCKDALIEGIKTHIHDGFYRKAVDMLKRENSGEIALVKRFILGYIAYSFARVGEVTEPGDGIHGIDKVMAYGFSWLPPSGWVDLLGGPKETRRLLEQCDLPVPEHLKGAAESPLCRIPETGKYLIAY
jgi:3-hydroxyacyl-CoA dehydrogenase